jgi:hypothetical protein
MCFGPQKTESWKEICFKHPGKWVALENAIINHDLNMPMIGTVVATNPDLQDLMNFLIENSIHGCILHKCNSLH